MAIEGGSNAVKFGVLLIYSVLDRKLREYGQLGLARNDEAVQRAIGDQVRGSGTLMEKYPGDFDLYCVGEFDSETGVVEGYPVPRLVRTVEEILTAVRGKEGN